MARAPMLPHGQAPPFTPGDLPSLERTVRWMVENLRTTQEAVVISGSGQKWLVEPKVSPGRYVYCRACGLSVGETIVIDAPLGGTSLDAETRWVGRSLCPDGGDDGGPPTGSGESGVSGSGEPSGSGVSGSGISGSGEPSGSGVSGSGVSGSGDLPSGDGLPSGSGGDGDGDGDGDGGGSSGGCGASGSGSGDGGTIRPPGEDDIGVCCAGGGFGELTASCEIVTPDGCAGGDGSCTGDEVTLAFTRDTLCGGEVVPAGQGYWRGEFPVIGGSGGNYKESFDIVAFCDKSANPGGPERDPSRMTVIVVDKATGCLNNEWIPISASCDPFELVGELGVGTDLCGGAGCIMFRVTVTL